MKTQQYFNIRIHIQSLIKKHEEGLDTIVNLFFILFMYAAMNKLMEFDKFQLQISKSPVITSLAPVLAWMIPSVEIVISIMLYLQRTVLIALYASIGLISLFTVYIIAVLNFNEAIPDNMGVLNNSGWVMHVFFNLVFVGLGILGVLLKTKRIMSEGIPANGSDISADQY